MGEENKSWSKSADAQTRSSCADLVKGEEWPRRKPGIEYEKN